MNFVVRWYFLRFYGFYAMPIFDISSIFSVLKAHGSSDLSFGCVAVFADVQPKIFIALWLSSNNPGSWCCSPKCPQHCLCSFCQSREFRSWNTWLPPACPVLRLKKRRGTRYRFINPGCCYASQENFTEEDRCVLRFSWFNHLRIQRLAPQWLNPAISNRMPVCSRSSS